MGRLHIVAWDVYVSVYETFITFSIFGDYARNQTIIEHRRDGERVGNTTNRIQLRVTFCHLRTHEILL